MKKKLIFIAEAGVNHNGSLLLAKELIDAASFAGADVIKFQSFDANKLVTKKAKKARNKPPINDIRITICSRYFVVSFP